MSGYKLPPAEVAQILESPATPIFSLSPTRTHALLTTYEAYPPLAMLAKPYLKLGGLRIDTTRPGTQNLTRYQKIALVTLPDGKAIEITGPTPASSPFWSLDGRKFAYLHEPESGGIQVCVGDIATQTATIIEGVWLADMLASPVQWQDDSRHLLVTLVPNNHDNYRAAPQSPVVPDGPVITETHGKRTRAATYQDLLSNTHDEDVFEYYATTQLARIDTQTGNIALLGEPSMFTGIRPSPDEEHLLITRLQRPFSYRVPYSLFARRTEVWSADGVLEHTIADLPVSDEVPQQGVPTGPRSVTWLGNTNASLLWAEAQDGGDPMAKVPHRDAIFRLHIESAFPAATPQEILRVVHRFAGWDWLIEPNSVFLTEYDRDRRWRTTYKIDLSNPDQHEVHFDLSINDAYGDPGDFIYHKYPDGRSLILQEGDFVYLAGRGASIEGDKPFLDKYNLITKEKIRLIESPYGYYATFAAFMTDTQTALFTRQSKTEPVNYFLVNVATQHFTPLTHFADPHPQITGMKKEIVKYSRADGVPLSGTLYLPPNWDGVTKLPLLLWAYPEEYSDAQTAGQIRGSEQTFTRLAGTSPLWFVLQGWAVLNDASMPVVGDPETMNDTFVEQITGAAQAAIDYLAERNIADKTRVIVAGHSYGAFMTANLLAHMPGVFRAGIARSGAYNRTLTPFGFQSERRSYWEAPQIYHNLSPFTYADKIKDPILLIHGQADNNPGTYTIQSERFFQALQANGATAKLVLLPHESHGYRAKESVLHVLAEMFEWAQEHAPPAPQ
jgi:dipeptidyl aminopeptidase/acylaminoacyl peptidase